MKRFLGSLLSVLLAIPSVYSSAASFTKATPTKGTGGVSAAAATPNLLEQTVTLIQPLGQLGLAAPAGAEAPLSPADVMARSLAQAANSLGLGIELPIKTDEARIPINGAFALFEPSGSSLREASTSSGHGQGALAQAKTDSNLTSPVMRALGYADKVRKDWDKSSASAQESAALPASQAPFRDPLAISRQPAHALLHQFVSSFSLGEKWTAPAQAGEGSEAELTRGLLGRLAEKMNLQHEQDFNRAAEANGLRALVEHIRDDFTHLAGSKNKNELLNWISIMQAYSKELMNKIDGVLEEARTAGSLSQSIRGASMPTKVRLGGPVDAVLAELHHFVGSFSLGKEMPGTWGGLLARLSEKVNAQHERLIGQKVHELRNFMSGIVVPLDVLKMSPSQWEGPESKGDIAQFMGILKRSISRMHEFLGEYRPHFEKVDLGGLLRDLREEQGAALKKDQTIDLEMPEGGADARADTRTLTMALRNLLSNAIKYTPKGGKITARVVHEGPLYHISVQDNGIGIGQKDIDTLLQGKGFYRAEAGKKMASGSGVGMTTILDALRVNGSSLKIESRDQGIDGTRFSFELPAWQGAP